MKDRNDRYFDQQLEGNSGARPRMLLDSELERDGVAFTAEMRAAVMRKAGAGKRSLLDKEIAIPKWVAAAIIVLIIAVPAAAWQQITTGIDDRAGNMTVDVREGDQEGNTQDNWPGKAGETNAATDRLVVSAGGVFYESQLREGWRRGQ